MPPESRQVHRQLKQGTASLDCDFDFRCVMRHLAVFPLEVAKCPDVHAVQLADHVFRAHARFTSSVSGDSNA